MELTNHLLSGAILQVVDPEDPDPTRLMTIPHNGTLDLDPSTYELLVWWSNNPLEKMSTGNKTHTRHSIILLGCTVAYCNHHITG